MSSYPLFFILCLAGSSVSLLILKRSLPASFLAAGFNSRSNHTTAARQIGGLACIPVCVCAIIIAGVTSIITVMLSISLSIAAMMLWVTGYLDDKNELSVRIRLAVQLISAMIALYGLGENFRLFPDLHPHWIETSLLCIVILSSINIANFMDGIDWMTVSGLGLPLLLLSIMSIFLLPDPSIAILGLTLSGALAGFALFNRPPALIFLGDSGSLPLGLLASITLLLFAAHAGIIPALILMLYYILDSASTIILRLRKAENILKSHSSHAYQKAKRSGKSVYYITGSIAGLNISLGIISALIVTFNTIEVQITGLFVALILTGLLIRHFRKERS